MNQLSKDKRVLILRLMVEGMSMAAITRTAGVSKNTVAKFLVDAGKALNAYQDKALRNLPCTRLEVDELWSFIYAKNKNVARAKSAPPEAGDVWTWIAICADTKLVPTWRIGDRTSTTGLDFMDDLRRRLSNRVQLTSDGHKPYFVAVREAFGEDVDYAMLIKVYGSDSKAEGPAHRRYSPGRINGSERIIVSGSPDLDKISTSYAERQNLSVRMSLRRFTRLTNAFSKKLENHGHAVSIYYMWYNYGRKHQSLKMTPAMAAGVTDRQWTVEDLVDVVEASLPKPGPRGPYKKREVSN